MNGLKVYLKSGIDSAYIFGSLAVAFVLIINALKQFESVHKPVLEVVLNATVGFSIILTFALRKRLRKYVRRLPGFLILCAGAVLLWNSYATLDNSQALWFSVLYYIGGTLIAIGLIEPMINKRYYIRMSKRGVRLRVHPFRTVRLSWSSITALDMDQRGIEIEVNGQLAYLVVPSQSYTPNMRARIIEIYRLAQKNGDDAPDEQMEGALA